MKRDKKFPLRWFEDYLKSQAEKDSVSRLITYTDGYENGVNAALNVIESELYINNINADDIIDKCRKELIQ